MEKKEDISYLWLEVWRKLRRDLDGVVAPQRITVLHVCITSAAHAGAGIFQIRACLKDTHACTRCQMTPCPPRLGENNRSHQRLPTDLLEKTRPHTVVCV